MSEICFLCERPFKFGSGAYHGRLVRPWGIMMCNSCDGSNHDGIVLEGHPRLREHLKASAVAIKLNARGWLDIPSRSA